MNWEHSISRTTFSIWWHWNWNRMPGSIRDHSQWHSSLAEKTHSTGRHPIYWWNSDTAISRTKYDRQRRTITKCCGRGDACIIATTESWPPNRAGIPLQGGWRGDTKLRNKAPSPDEISSQVWIVVFNVRSQMLNAAFNTYLRIGTLSGCYKSMNNFEISSSISGGDCFLTTRCVPSLSSHECMWNLPLGSGRESGYFQFEV